MSQLWNLASIFAELCIHLETKQLSRLEMALAAADDGTEYLHCNSGYTSLLTIVDFLQVDHHIFVIGY